MNKKECFLIRGILNYRLINSWGKSKVSYYRGIDSVVEALERARNEGIKVNLLIGAGCSVTAGIPIANGIIEKIKNKYPAEVGELTDKTYADYMAKLTPIERRKLINECVRESKINWAHIGMAHLMNNNFIHRVLTTNFDNIFLRAGSLVGEFPGIYDMTTYGGDFRSDLLSEKSILYLHGQHTSFVLCNTEKEVEEQREKLSDTFNELKRNSMWLIVGYSCTNDAIWQLLSNEPSFENRLYLIGYENEQPNDNMKNILSEDRYAFYVNGYNADSFFISLMKSLNIFPPKIIDKPFSYLSDAISSITDYKNNDSLLEGELNGAALEILDDAIKNYEENNIRMAKYYWQLGLFDKFNELMKEMDKDNHHEIIEYFEEYNSKIEIKVKKLLMETEKKHALDSGITKKLREATELMSINKESLGEDFGKVMLTINNIYDNIGVEALEHEDIINWINCIIKRSEYDSSTNPLDELKRAEGILSKKISNQKEDSIILNELSLLYLRMAKIDEENCSNYIEKLLTTIEDAYNKDTENIEVIIDWGTYLLNIIKLKEEEWEDLLKKAEMKYYEAIEIAEKKEKYKILEVYADELIKLSIDIQEQVVKDRFIEKAFATYSEIYAYGEFNNIINSSWESSIIKIIKCKDINEYIKYILTYINNVKLMLVKFKKERYLSKLTTKINNVSYALIQEKIFNLAEQLISICIDINKTDSFVCATKGLWFLKNSDLEVEEREKQGNKYYEEAVELSSNDVDLSLAIKQKNFFEYGVFLYEVKEEKEKGLNYLKTALNFGCIEPYVSNVIEIERYMISNNIKIKEIYENDIIKDEEINILE